MAELCYILYKALDIYIWIIIASVVFSWLFAFNVLNRYNPFSMAIGRFFYTVTEPVYRPIRNLLPDLGGLDVSPAIVMIAIFLIQRYVLIPVMLGG